MKQDAISSHLDTLFGATLSVDKGQLYVDEGGKKVEILFSGEALRKVTPSSNPDTSILSLPSLFLLLIFLQVFATLVLLYSLINKSERQKVFLLEEPEAHLYPFLQQGVFELIFMLVHTYNVQLIVTTNSKQIFSSVDVRYYFECPFLFYLRFQTFMYFLNRTKRCARA